MILEDKKYNGEINFDGKTLSGRIGIKNNATSYKAAGRFHDIKCNFCGRANRISLELIKAQKEFDDFMRKSLAQNGALDEITANQPTIVDFRCGACNMPLANTFVPRDDTSSSNSFGKAEIYTDTEYAKHVGSIVDSWSNKPINRVNKDFISNKLEQAESERNKDK